MKRVINKYIILLSIVTLSMGLQAQLTSATPPDAGKHASSTNFNQGDIYYVKQLPNGEYSGLMFDVEGNQYPVATFDGTWWTTWNMRAKSFPSGDLINGGTPNTSTELDVVQFSYPTVEGASPLLLQPYWDKMHGLLYNWPATINMTASNNPSGPTPPHNNINQGANAGAGSQLVGFQGICPTGWHVPSDVEWNELEAAIYNMPQKYSTNLITFSPVVWQPSWNTIAGLRGSFSSAGHGTAMKSAFRVGGTATDPTSNSSSATMGGFNIFPLGLSDSNAAGYYGNKGYLWTSSGATDDTSWSRVMASNDNRVVRDPYYQYYHFSVRCKKPTPGIRTDLDIYHLPSGHDNRTLVETIAKITNERSDKSITISVPTATLGAGVNFNPALVTSLPIGGTHNLGMTPVAITAPSSMDPWKSRESKITLSLTADPTVKKEIRMNQTNYAITISNSLIASQIKMRDTDEKQFPIQSNAGWKITIDDPHNIFETPTILTGGEDNMKGGSSSTNFKYTASAGGAGTRLLEATLTIEDSNVEKRAKPITIKATQCQGTPDISMIPTAPADVSEWGTKTLLHPAKPGVYEEFVSADFGAGGRWMTTHLSAMAYDGINHSSHGTAYARTLEGPNANATNSMYTAYWAYPSNIPKTSNASQMDPLNPTTWNGNKHLGYLYTWDAATAGRGGKYGEDINTNEGGEDHATIQGICPAGWHIPTDYEWTLLENAIIQHTSRYSNLEDLNPDEPNTLPQNKLTGTRGSGHALAMKEICEPNTNTTKQKLGSNPLSEAGFSLLLAGRVQAGSATTFGSYSFLWSSSSSISPDAWARYVNDYLDGVNKVNGVFRHNMCSVRCKKD